VEGKGRREEREGEGRGPLGAGRLISGEGASLASMVKRIAT
jgi:hypothetical protein